jgi:hypothetical protein
VKRFLTSFSLLALAAGAIGAGPATPPPSPPPLSVPSLPPEQPNAAGTPAPVAPGTLPTPTSSTLTIPISQGTATPAPPKNESDPNRIGISGVWEVQIQRDSNTTYTHFKLAQKQTILTGQYLDSNGKKYPLAGSLSGKDIRVVVSMPDGTTTTFAGSLDGTTDMLGMMQTSKENVAFTATYRPKYKWIDNISPNPGLGP